MGSKTRLYDPRYQHFCQLIRRWRLEAHLTQEELGRRLRRPVSFVSKCELAERRVDAIELVDWINATGIPHDRAIRELNAI